MTVVALWQTSGGQGARRLPLIIEGSIPDMLNLVSRQLKDLGNVGCHVIHGALPLGADVVDLPHLAAVQDHVEGLGNILHV